VATEIPEPLAARNRPDMSLIPNTLEQLEHASAQLFDRLAARPRLAAAALHALALYT
jgi:hypothetical protein